MKFRMIATALVLAGLCTAGMSYAADTKTQPAKAPEQAASPSPQEKAWMDWMQKNVPGDAHKQLAQCAGEWNMVVKSWMAPDAPPTSSAGTSSSKMILDGRYLQESASGSMGGMPFTGMGITGYDIASKKYETTWIDNMSTATFRANGTYDAATKTVTMNGTTYDPTVGKDVPVKTVLRLIDDKSHVFEWWAPDPSGKMFKSMEITYTRQGS